MDKKSPQDFRFPLKTLIFCAKLSMLKSWSPKPSQIEATRGTQTFHAVYETGAKRFVERPRG